MIIHLTQDLMMSSRARSFADQAKLEIKFLSSLEQLSDAISADEVKLIFLDLQMPGLDIDALAETVKPHQAIAFGYVQHVHVDLIQKVRALEFCEVLTRGQFNNGVGQLIASVAS